MIIFVLIIICLFFISIIVIDDKNKQIKELESIIEYYKWHDGIYDLPKNSAWYLAQTENKDKKIKVLFYDTERQQWCKNQFSWAYTEYVIAWCHLPNHLFHK